jgi:hypothetical protein
MGTGCCDVDVSTRKIDNGYIERTSYYNPKTGEYKSSEKFTTKPNGGDSSYGAVGCEVLGDTKKYLGNDV